VRTAIEAVGVTITYLPPYSPDFNPIELVFSKLKALLKKSAHRTIEALRNEISKLLDAFSPDECRYYVGAAGYYVWLHRKCSSTHSGQAESHQVAG